MKAEIQALLHKAQDSLDAANLLHREHYYDFAVSRAYYGMFYLAEAFLLTKGSSFSSHAAVIAAFGREFARPGTVDAQYHRYRYLIDAEDLRHTGDYGVSGSLTELQAVEVLGWAEEFFKMARSFLAARPGGADVQET